MSEIISEEVLVNELNHFRYILTHYDYKEVSNVIFFDIESLSCYMQTHADNPFERQYREIEAALEKLSPYLPSSISSETIEILQDMLSTQSNYSNLLREQVLFNLKLDFIEWVKGIRTEEEWHKLLLICEKLRQEKLMEESIKR